MISCSSVFLRLSVQVQKPTNAIQAEMKPWVLDLNWTCRHSINQIYLSHRNCHISYIKNYWSKGLYLETKIKHFIWEKHLNWKCACQFLRLNLSYVHTYIYLHIYIYMMLGYKTTTNKQYISVYITKYRSNTSCPNSICFWQHKISTPKEQKSIVPNFKRAVPVCCGRLTRWAGE